MGGELTSEIIADGSIVIDYIDDYLRNRLKDDGTEDIGELAIDGGVHLGCFNKNRLIGVVSFGLFDGYCVIHPKFKREHMIYAKKGCLMAIDQMKRLGEKGVIAMIPDIFEGNKRMAVACDMIEIESDEQPVKINGKTVEIKVYARSLL